MECSRLRYVTSIRFDSQRFSFLYAAFQLGFSVFCFAFFIDFCPMFSPEENRRDVALLTFGIKWCDTGARF